MISHPYRELIETSYNFVFILFYFMEIRGVGGLEPHVDNSYIDVVSYASIWILGVGFVRWRWAEVMGRGPYSTQVSSSILYSNSTLGSMLTVLLDL